MKGPRSVAFTGVVAALASTPLVRALYQNGTTFTPCDSPLYCRGDILKQIELAQPFSDSKTFVDLPTKKPLDEVLASFDALSKPLSNNTELQDFLTANFGEAGSELEAVDPDDLKTDAAFLDKIDDGIVREFTQQVIDIWPDLTRRYVGAGNCSGCVSSFIPLNRTFVVAGGRFREPYYWDSYWIIEGLLRSGGSFTEISRNIIENFLDFVELYGFVPNGARLYYLNRSQPPLLTQMVKIYVDYTNDTSLLDRALPLLIKEHDFWIQNRTIDITSNGTTYSLAHYAALNTEPRPESYREDYITANNHSYYATSGIIYPEVKPLSEAEKAALYANLATGAESGWDYGTRILATPRDAADDVYFPLRSLNTANTVGVDLNSILYANEVAIAGYLRATATGNNLSNSAAAVADEFESLAANRSAAMYALMWNDEHFGYFDYNLTSKSQNLWVPLPSNPDDIDSTTVTEGAPEGYQLVLQAAQFYPFWLGAAPAHLKNNPLAVSRVYSRVAALLDARPGAGVAATNYASGQQWDRPNVWPPLVHAVTSGLLKTPPTFGGADQDPAYRDTQKLALRLAQRYLDSAFCTWRATGGATSELPRLGDDVVGDAGADGIMFEKYSDESVSAAGSGGEYDVVEGFGWTNGVLIWAVDTFGNALVRPDCGGNLTVAARGLEMEMEQKSVGRGSPRRAVELSRDDARWVKKFGRRAREAEAAAAAAKES